MASVLLHCCVHARLISLVIYNVLAEEQQQLPSVSCWSMRNITVQWTCVQCR